MVSDGTTDRIKERLSIVDVIQSYIRLEKAGANYRARCPFHNERTPSFHVSPVRESFYCFGCNKGGDIFTFVQDIEGLDFKGALKVLADRAGIPLETKKGKQALEERDAQEVLFDILERATLFFQKTLVAHKDGLSYLYGRGVKPATLKAFRVGFAPDSWDALLTELTHQGFSVSDIERAGLVVKKEKAGDAGRTHYDRFRDRIMFPIADTAGRIVGFSGRIFPTGKEGSDVAKYVNSPETEVFHKSRVLFGFDKAKQAIRQSGRVVVVEGQMDLIMSHQAGVGETVASSGTALTELHLAHIKRLAEKVVFAFDNDQAGRKALLRAGDLAYALGFDVLVPEGFEGKDPADLVKENADAWIGALTHARPLIRALLESLPKGALSREDVLSMKKEVLPLIARIPGSLERAFWVKETAKHLGVSEEDVRGDLAHVPKKETEEEKAKEVHTTNLSPIQFLSAVSVWEDALPEGNTSVRTLIDEILGEGITLGIAPPEHVFRAEEALARGDPEEIVRDLVRLVRKEHVRGLLDAATRALRRAEAEKNHEEIVRLTTECGTLATQLHKLS